MLPAQGIEHIQDKPEAAPGEVITLTAVLPEDEETEFWDFVWSAGPGVEFAADGSTASFAMPASAVEVACALAEKPLEETATRRVLRLGPGWNLVTLCLTPDGRSLARLAKFPAMALDPLNHIYVRVREGGFAADSLYWLYAPEATRLVVTGEAAAASLPQGDGWLPYGAFPETTLDGHELWQWQAGAFQSLAEPQAIPGRGYFIRSNN